MILVNHQNTDYKIYTDTNDLDIKLNLNKDSFTFDIKDYINTNIKEGVYNFSPIEYYKTKNGFYIPIIKCVITSYRNSRMYFFKSVLNHTIAVRYNKTNRNYVIYHILFKRFKISNKLYLKDYLVYKLINNDIDIFNAIKIVYGKTDTKFVINTIKRYFSNPYFYKTLRSIIMELYDTFKNNGLNPDFFAKYIKNILLSDKSNHNLKKYALEILYNVLKDNNIKNIDNANLISYDDIILSISDNTQNNQLNDNIDIKLLSDNSDIIKHTQ